eukprot:813289-Amphidinium_carterae.1
MKHNKRLCLGGASVLTNWLHLARASMERASLAGARYAGESRYLGASSQPTERLAVVHLQAEDPAVACNT